MSSKKAVIIALDGSQQSEEAFEWYLKTLYKDDQWVVLLHVASMFYGEGEHSIMSPTHSPDFNKTRLQRNIKTGEHLLERYKKKLEEKKISGNVEHKVGKKPGPCIVDVANEYNALAIVVAQRGMGLLKRTLMGSVSDYVINHATCATWVYRQSKEGRERSDSQRQRSDSQRQRSDSYRQRADSDAEPRPGSGRQRTDSSSKAKDSPKIRKRSDSYNLLDHVDTAM